MNAIQIWVTCCIFMVFLALLEYGLILWMRCKPKHGLTNKTHQPAIPNFANQERPASANNKTATRNKWVVEKSEINSKNTFNFNPNWDNRENDYPNNETILDQISIIIFPTSFIAFNIWYWITFI